MPPLLDLAALQGLPLKNAVTLPGLDHPAFPGVLAAALPGVQHSRKSWPALDEDEHSLIDPATGSAVRIIIAWDQHQCRARTCIAEIGPRPLFDELVTRLGEWERHGRTIPDHWQGAAQREPHHRHGSFEPAIARQLPSRAVSLSDLDLQVRDELDAVTAEQDRAVVALLAGEPTVANAVALDWSHANVDRYEHGQLHADLAGDTPEPLAPSTVLGGWLTALGLEPRQIPDELHARMVLFRSITHDRRITVLLENALSASQVRPLLPNSPHSLAVVTSRWLLGGLLMDGARLVDAGAVDPVSGSAGVGR